MRVAGACGFVSYHTAYLRHNINKGLNDLLQGKVLNDQLRFLFSYYARPGRPFHNFGASKSVARRSELFKIRQSPDLKALKLCKRGVRRPASIPTTLH